MIVKLTAPTGLRFSGATVPEAVQDLALRHAVVARVVSWSMYPTLRPGDRLDIEPAEPIALGDLLVYRRPGGLVCHRVIGIDIDMLAIRGDAGVGPADPVRREEVIGKVVAIERGRVRLTVEELTLPEVTADASHPRAESHPAGMRHYVVCTIRALLSRRRIGPILSRWIIRLCTAEPLEQPPTSLFAAAFISPSPSQSTRLSPDHRLSIPLPCLLRFGSIPLGVIDPTGLVMLRPALAGTCLESTLTRAL